MGDEEYRYIATLDERTCEHCQPLDGQVFKVSEARESVNFLVMHPRCRCITTINIKYHGRRAKDPETGKSYITDGDMTYKEWKESLPEEKRAALDTAVKKTRNKYSDRQQLERYKAVLGVKNMPRGLDKFQDLKYNDSNSGEYSLLKKTYHEVKWQVKAQKNLTKARNLPNTNIPNSVIDKVIHGKITQRRYYGRTGKPRLDIDLTDHGNPKRHPIVPHYHGWKELQNGDIE